MSKKRVFVSFDFDNDQFLKESLIGQAKNPDSPFEVTDGSLKEAAPERDWLAKAEQRIRQADMMVVMLGERTMIAPGVKKEVDIAKRLNKPTVQIIGYKNKLCLPVSGAGPVYNWDWPSLEQIFR